MHFASLLGRREELAYAERTSNATINTTVSDIGGLTITFTATSTQAMLIAGIGQITKDATAGYVWCSITDAANAEYARDVRSVIASGFCSVSLARKVTGLVVGNSYTFKMRGVTGAGAGTVVGDPSSTKPFITAWAL